MEINKKPVEKKLTCQDLKFMSGQQYHEFLFSLCLDKGMKKWCDKEENEYTLWQHWVCLHSIPGHCYEVLEQLDLGIIHDAKNMGCTNL